MTTLVGAAIEGMRAILIEFRRQSLSDSHFDQVAADVIELRRVVDGLEVEWNRRVAHLREAGRTGLEGHSSVTAWLKDQCRMSDARAHRAVVFSGQLTKLPFVRKAFESDDLSFDQIQVFAHVPEHLAEDLAGDEVSLVNSSGSCRWPTPAGSSNTGRLRSMHPELPLRQRSWPISVTCSQPRPLREW